MPKDTSGHDSTVNFDAIRCSDYGPFSHRKNTSGPENHMLDCHVKPGCAGKPTRGRSRIVPSSY